MKLNKKTVFLFFIILIFTVLSAAFFSSVWHYMLGATPKPHIWLLVCLYLLLHRPLTQSLPQGYVILFFLTYFSSVSVAYLWLPFLLLSFVVHFIKSRMFWPGARYFAILSIAFTFGFEVLSYLTLYFTSGKLLPLRPIERFFELFFTVALSPFVYSVLTQIDRMFAEESFSEVGRIED